jgi:hypothetical protein
MKSKSGDNQFCVEAHVLRDEILTFIVEHFGVNF